jgi:hypothetical protein
VNKHLSSSCCALWRVSFLFVLLALGAPFARGEAMLELFQLTWPQITQKMPEIAEAGYDSLWVPNPAKGNSGSYSIGYDQFDPFDLGSTNQAGTVATLYGTQTQLIQMVQTAHRFGIRIYFDNVMNHRSSTVPGYPGSGTPTNYYPGLVPGDFHLQTVSGGYKNWDSVSDWCNTANVQDNPLLGLCDLANEPGTVNDNFGSTYLNHSNKPVFIRFPGRPDLYEDTNGPLLGTGWGGMGWRPFDGHGQPVAEDVSTYLCRAVAWTLYMTKCDGFRLDAVKHVPVGFFGNETGQTDDSSFAGYTGAIQAQYDYVHGYGNNVTTNGYVETDGNRNSLFSTETTRNDAMIFGEYVPSALVQGNDFYDYLNSGMRLLNQPLYNQMNSAFGGSTMAGMDSRDYEPSAGNCDGNGNYSPAQAVNMPQTQDGGTCCPSDQALEDSYFFMHEGLPMVYSDGFNHNPSGGTPIASYANYLGEFGDNSMPDVMYLHNQLARGGTWSRWSDQNIVAFERYDYREGTNTQPWTQDVVLFAMNDNFGDPGDEYFCDGVDDILPSSYAVPAGTGGNMQGMVVNFPIGTVLYQLATSTPGYSRTFKTVTVRTATNTKSAANGSTVYVGGQTIPAGGGAIEFMIPSGGWVMYGLQGPQPSQANPSTNAIVLQQGGVEVPRILVNRTDGPNGDAAYNPLFPFKMRGSVDQYGNVIGGVNVSNKTYAIDMPIVTNANFDILVRSDASCDNTLVKLDGGMDLNSQMGMGPLTFNGTAPTNFLDLRDNKPGYADDVFLGYEQAKFLYRNGPEKFAARNTANDNIVSLGAETYYYTVGGSSNVVTGSGYGAGISNQTAFWVQHDPTNSVTSLSSNPPNQRNPLSPSSGQAADIWVKVAYSFEINTCFIYYTTDGSNPEGAFGTGKGTTQVIQGHYVNRDTYTNNTEWWKGTIPAQSTGTQVRYKVALYYGGNAGGTSINDIYEGESQGSKLYGLTQFVITNFNPTTATVWLHNDLNPANTVTGLQPGFHILRARTFLNRPGQSSAYNTFSQTFYYDGALPTGVIAFPTGGSTLGSSTYQAVVRGDSTVTSVQYNIQNTLTNNWDIYTGQTNGIGNTLAGAPIFVTAPSVTPNTGLSATYTNYPQEFRFNYNDIPSSGTATINVRLNEYATGVYTNRYTMLATTVNAAAPSEVVDITSPLTNGAVLPYNTNVTYLLQACFSPALTPATANFNIFINGVLQPQSSYFFQASGGNQKFCPNMRTVQFNWNNPPVGTNLIQVIYTNAVTPISDSSTLTVVPPLLISGIVNQNQLILWNSAPGVNYEVLATTNLTQPFQPISTIIPSQGTTTSFYDPNPEQQKFYEIEMVQ